MYRKLIFGAFALFIVCTVRAEVFGFNRITSNATNNVANQFFMDVSDIDEGYARVVFTNTGPAVTASISEIYFGSHTSSDAPSVAIESVTSFDNGGTFTIGNVQPASPPGVNKSSWFTLAAAQAASPASQAGINAHESLIMDLSYDGGLSFAQLISGGQIQVALHVISIDGGESDTFVNDTSVTVIPEPASMIMIGTTGSFIAFVRRRFY